MTESEIAKFEADAARHKLLRLSPAHEELIALKSRLMRESRESLPASISTNMTAIRKERTRCQFRLT